MRGYEEWKIEYTVENSDTMPEPAGRIVAAYLLVPADKRYKPPFPAMICYHQCFMDCELGKEAVVGKAVDRPDQAYGYELVQEGFVVLAPDAIGCGERHLPWITPPEKRCGQMETRECLFKAQFTGDGTLERRLGKNWNAKVVLDGMRAVDLLQSLDFVDPERIGAIGHSLGAGQTAIHMTYDPRVKAGIVSGGGPDEAHILAGIAPRLFMRLHGLYDQGWKKVQETEAIHKLAKGFYREKGSEDNLLLWTLPCGHHFHDEFKWETYARLKKYFGIAVRKERVTLEDVLAKAREDSSWAWRGDELFPPIESTGRHNLTANYDQLRSAFSLLFVHLCQKRPAGSPLRVNVRTEKKTRRVICFVPGGDDNVKVAHDYYYQVRKAEQLLHENGGSLHRENTAGGIRYSVTLKKNQ